MVQPRGRDGRIGTNLSTRDLETVDVLDPVDRIGGVPRDDDSPGGLFQRTAHTIKIPLLALVEEEHRGRFREREFDAPPDAAHPGQPAFGASQGLFGRQADVRNGGDAPGLYGSRHATGRHQCDDGPPEPPLGVENAHTTITGIFPIIPLEIRACHSFGPVSWTEVPCESTATVTGMS